MASHIFSHLLRRLVCRIPLVNWGIHLKAVGEMQARMYGKSQMGEKQKHSTLLHDELEICYLI